jgi:hypothetical protein
MAAERPLTAWREALMRLSLAGLLFLNLVMVFGVQALFAPSSPKVLDYAACYVQSPIDPALYPYAQTQLVRYSPNPRCVVGIDAYWEGLTLNDLFQAKRTGLRPLVAQWLRALLGR